MQGKTTYNRSLFLLVPLLAASLLFFVLTLSGSLDARNDSGNGMLQSRQVNLEVKDQKNNVPVDHDFVLSPIFKFIINCNPFKKDASF